jgi:hypothetical protein
MLCDLQYSIFSAQELPCWTEGIGKQGEETSETSAPLPCMRNAGGSVNVIEQVELISSSEL